MTTDAEELKRRYESFAKSLDYKTTASDFHLRELKIDTGAVEMRDGMAVLDVGCGLGYATCQYALRRKVSVAGIDYAANMIEGAEKLLRANFLQFAPTAGPGRVRNGQRQGQGRYVTVRSYLPGARRKSLLHGAVRGDARSERAVLFMLGRAAPAGLLLTCAGASRDENDRR